MLKSGVFIGVAFCLSLSAESVIEPPPYSPWFTGPLLAPIETAVPWGHFEMEPYLFVTVNTGLYGKNWDKKKTPKFYSVNPLLYFVAGVTPFMDVQIAPAMFYNESQGSSSVQFGDFPIGVDIQVVDAYRFKWFPGIKFTVKETFPTGKYQNFDPHGHGTQLGGQGSYQTNLNLLFYKVLNIYDHHYMSLILSYAFNKETPVLVHGFNSYGGGYDTRGTVYPGDSSQVIFSFEYTLTQNWVLAMDASYVHTNKTSFRGKKGTTSDGSEAKVGFPSSEQISFAPAIEYNFSLNMGLIGGIWFTAYGRNTASFISGVLEFTYTY